jgi:hypothetical protein
MVAVVALAWKTEAMVPGRFNEFAADVDGYLVDRAGELERVAGVGDHVWT